MTYVVPISNNKGFRNFATYNYDIQVEVTNHVQVEVTNYVQVEVTKQLCIDGSYQLCIGRSYQLCIGGSYQLCIGRSYQLCTVRSYQLCIVQVKVTNYVQVTNSVYCIVYRYSSNYLIYGISIGLHPRTGLLVIYIRSAMIYALFPALRARNQLCQKTTSIGFAISGEISRKFVKKHEKHEIFANFSVFGL